jgi:adenosylcobinamide amidohydrolase
VSDSLPQDPVAHSSHYQALRKGRYIIVELIGPHQVLSTSAYGGGQRDDLRYLINHQSCEGSGHSERFELLMELGDEGYHRHVCSELELPPEAVALMGTAANMAYAATAEASHAELCVQSIVTAGVEGNAGTAGDPARWHERDEGWSANNPNAGTINTIVLVNWPLTPAALARAVITATEGKTATLQELAISSRYSADMTTGTGTDQYCIAAPVDAGKTPKTNSGHHAKLGELIGSTVRRATLEALRWQNGLEPSYTRGLVHALRRFGFSEDHYWRELESRLEEDLFVLLKKNAKPVLFEPQIAAAAYAFAAV